MTKYTVVVTNHRLIELLNRYKTEGLSNEEFEELLTYLDADANQEEAQTILEEALQNQQEISASADEAIERIAQNVKLRLDNSIQPTKILSFRKILPYAAAIALLIIGAVVVTEFFKSTDMPPESFAQNESNQQAPDLPPGTNRAYILLENGKQIVLDENKEGIKVTDAGITYYSGDTVLSGREIATYSVVTPKGGEYHITLPDGSKVWLNADSRLTYPSRFSSTRRQVSVQGEAFFDIAPNTQAPFIVKTVNQEIQVLGTTFNVNAYKDEAISATTLINGSVRVLDFQTGHTVTLKPGQQAASSTFGLEVETVSTGKVTAWKDGYFEFDGADLSYVLRQLGRWYNVETVLEGVPDRKLHARIKRDKNLQTVLSVLSQTTGTTIYLQQRRLVLMK